MSDIQPFGTSADGANPNLAQIKLFGCTVVDFNVSADWSSQGGSLSCRLIEDETGGDRLVIPVLGTPVLFELKDSFGNVLFQYIGLVDSFSRASSNSKTYSVNLTSPLKILESTSVILDGYAGMGSSIEGLYNIAGLGYQDYGHNNALIDVLSTVPGTYHWWNISNLINVFGILENDDLKYRVPTSSDNQGNPLSYGGFGYSGRSEDGIPLIKLMWALHMGINHVPPISDAYRQRTHGGNLLFGRHNYDIRANDQGIPYYYHFDALHFYNQIVGKLGSEFRVEGQYKTLREIITSLCDEANLEYFSYIDIYTDPTIGEPTLQEQDTLWTSPAICNWNNIDTRKFPLGGKYGGTIRIQTVDKNTFFNPNRPFSNIAYNLIGLEVPDIYDNVFQQDNAIHPGERPGQPGYGLANNITSYSDPLDSYGLNSSDAGFWDVGTKSISLGGKFPVYSGEAFDPSKLSDLKIKNSDISIRMNDVTTMKVITGGYQSRLVTVPGNMLRHYWGDIILPNGADPREIADTATDPLGLNEVSVRKIPVVTPILDPRDCDDYILVDMQSHFGNLTIPGVFQNGIYAASLLEIRCAMRSESSWKAFFYKYKYGKLRKIKQYFYPYCISPVYPPGKGDASKEVLEKSTEDINASGGLGYAGLCETLGLGNAFSLIDTIVDALSENFNSSGIPKSPPDSGVGPFGLGLNLTCAAAEMNVKRYILPPVSEKLKEIGDTHYGKSWYAPVPYAQTIQNLDGENLVGNFTRSWELSTNAYVEPSLYYSREVPQSNSFISDGKVSAFVNYDHNFIATGGQYDKSYAQEITSLIGQTTQVFNFSEYSLDALCITKYGGINIIHASPQNIESQYSFLPFAYDRIYNRAALPYSDIITGQRKRWVNSKSASGVAPNTEGQSGTDNSEETTEDNKTNTSPVNRPECAGASGQLPDASGYFTTDVSHNIPYITNPSWLASVVPSLQSLDYNDNGRFCFPFVKFTTSRVFLPVPSPASLLSPQRPSMYGFNVFTGGNSGICETGNPLPARPRQSLITEDTLISILNPFQACVAPRSFSYPQTSTRYVYGPWMTSLEGIIFRGKIEYEQDESLVPENFLIPTNFGPFGNYQLDQTSGFTGMNLAAQGRANSIDNFGLFALEEGSITFPGGPGIKRIGDSLYGIQQVTDIKINIANDNIETTYSFKTISPKFGKNTRDLEKKLTKISNDIKKLKLR
jgi:hypothetical protein